MPDSMYDTGAVEAGGSVKPLNPGAIFSGQTQVPTGPSWVYDPMPCGPLALAATASTEGSLAAECLAPAYRVSRPPEELSTHLHLRNTGSQAYYSQEQQLL